MIYLLIRRIWKISVSPFSSSVNTSSEICLKYSQQLLALKRIVFWSQVGDLWWCHRHSELVWAGSWTNNQHSPPKCSKKWDLDQIFPKTDSINWDLNGSRNGINSESMRKKNRSMELINTTYLKYLVIVLFGGFWLRTINYLLFLLNLVEMCVPVVTRVTKIGLLRGYCSQFCANILAKDMDLSISSHEINN